MVGIRAVWRRAAAVVGWRAECSAGTLLRGAPENTLCAKIRNTAADARAAARNYLAASPSRPISYADAPRPDRPLARWSPRTRADACRRADGPHRSREHAC